MDTFQIVLLIPYFDQLQDLNASLATVCFEGKMLVLVVDDGSPPESALTEVWAEQSSQTVGHPVHVILRKENGGIEAALNDGLRYIFEHVKTEYVARLDCGDMNLPERFQRQVEYMESHPQVALLGTWAAVVNGTVSKYVIRSPAKHRAIRNQMLSQNCFVHPSVIMRTSAMEQVGFYPANYPAAEDYAYFFLFVKSFETANLPIVLLRKTREHSSLSFRRRRRQLLSRLKVILHNFRLHPYSLWGLFRTASFLIIPTRMVEGLKEIFFHDRSAHH